MARARCTNKIQWGSFRTPTLEHSDLVWKQFFVHARTCPYHANLWDEKEKQEDELLLIFRHAARVVKSFYPYHLIKSGSLTHDKLEEWSSNQFDYWCEWTVVSDPPTNFTLRTDLGECVVWNLDVSKKFLLIVPENTYCVQFWVNHNGQDLAVASFLVTPGTEQTERMRVRQGYTLVVSQGSYVPIAVSLGMIHEF